MPDGSPAVAWRRFSFENGAGRAAQCLISANNLATISVLPHLHDLNFGLASAIFYLMESWLSAGRGSLNLPSLLLPLPVQVLQVQQSSTRTDLLVPTTTGGENCKCVYAALQFPRSRVRRGDGLSRRGGLNCELMTRPADNFDPGPPRARCSNSRRTTSSRSLLFSAPHPGC